MVKGYKTHAEMIRGVVEELGSATPRAIIDLIKAMSEGRSSGKPSRTACFTQSISQLISLPLICNLLL